MCKGVCREVKVLEVSSVFEVLVGSAFADGLLRAFTLQPLNIKKNIKYKKLNFKRKTF